MGRGSPSRVLGLLASLVVPVLLYYALRGVGVAIYPALLTTSALSAVPSLVQLVRRRKVSGVGLYFSLMSLAALVIAVIPGSTEVLLAKGAVLTAATGIVFLVSLRARHPMVYTLTRPLLEGRLNWPGEWGELYGASARFRRMWAVSTVMWGMGLLADAAGRVAMAFALPADVVPALATVLYVVTLVVLNVATHGYYIASGVFRPGSRLYAHDAG